MHGTTPNTPLGPRELLRLFLTVVAVMAVYATTLYVMSGA